MPTLHEQLTGHFYRWEQRGRGWRVYGEAVCPKPPLVPFDGHYLPKAPVIDDGRKPTFLSRLSRKRAANPEPPPIVPEPDDEPGSTPLIRSNLVEPYPSLSADLDIPIEGFEQFLLNLSLPQTVII